MQPLPLQRGWVLMAVAGQPRVQAEPHARWAARWVAHLHAPHLARRPATRLPPCGLCVRVPGRKEVRLQGRQVECDLHTTLVANRCESLRRPRRRVALSVAQGFFSWLFPVPECSLVWRWQLAAWPMDPRSCRALHAPANCENANVQSRRRELRRLARRRRRPRLRQRWPWRRSTR